MPTDPLRPKRFIVIPKAGRGEPQPTAAATRRQLHASAAALAAGRGGTRVAANAARALTVVNSAPADGSVLVEATNVAQVEARAPAGAEVYAEQWYSLERPVLPWLKLAAPLRVPRTRAGHTMDFTVTVVLDDVARTRLADAYVMVLVDEATGTGYEATTDRRGRARFTVSSRLQRVDAIGVQPLHGGWPVRLSQVDLGPAGLEIEVPAIDLAEPDVRGLVYGQAVASAGRGVKVGVVDTGVGPHGALTLAGGRNTTTESPRRQRDEQGHGSHVAGVIAATAAGWRRGEASAVELFAYRVFEAGDDSASNFAIQAAIKQAALDGCDLINLSIGGGGADPAVRRAVAFAWDRGCVCLAATGNDYGAAVCYPARYPKVIAVSAIGLENSWPAGTDLGATLSPARGKAIGGHATFLASFSNIGTQVALTAPGVAVVSTIHGDRWGVMDGTSMATPIATGVLARRLASSPAVLGLPRDGARSAAIVQLAHDHAEDLGLSPRMQGAGLAR